MTEAIIPNAGGSSCSNDKAELMKGAYSEPLLYLQPVGGICSTPSTICGNGSQLFWTRGTPTYLFVN